MALYPLKAHFRENISLNTAMGTQFNNYVLYCSYPHQYTKSKTKYCIPSIKPSIVKSINVYILIQYSGHKSRSDHMNIEQNVALAPVQLQHNNQSLIHFATIPQPCLYSALAGALGKISTKASHLSAAGSQPILNVFQTSQGPPFPIPKLNSSLH